MADSDNTLNLLIKFGILDEAKAEQAKQMLKETGEATADLGAKTEKATEKFGEHRHELREVGNELGRAAGISRGGALALGGVAAAAFAAGKAIEFLKDTLAEVQESIKGPIEFGIPEDAPAHISAAAEAWEAYAIARSKVVSASTGAEAAASAQEKQLANELKLIKEVLAAEKEKALADLERAKGTMTPEAYEATKGNINNIFGAAGTSAEQNNRRRELAIKDMEASNLEIDAKKKTAQALAIKAAPKEEAAANQKILDENAANGEKAKKELQERIAMIDRSQRYSAGGNVVEYEGAGGKAQRLAEQYKLYTRYGRLDDLAGARDTESHRLAQAQAQIDIAASYRERQATGSERRKQLMDEAGSESGRAAGLRGEVRAGSQFEAAQTSTDARVAQLHSKSTAAITTASRETAEAVKEHTDAVLRGFSDIKTQLNANRRYLEQRPVN